MVNGRMIFAVGALTLLASCEPAENVRVQPLPPLERPSPEARAGLPEVAGVWRFAGWDLAPTDSANLQRPLPGLGEIRLQTQRLDSLAGAYIGPSGALPVVGEVRRDSIVSLVANAGGELGFFLAGEYARDTLWIRMSSLVEPGTWPSDALAAFVRAEVSSPFVRLHGTTAPPPVDSAALLAADSTIAPDSFAVAAAQPSAPDSLTRVVTVPPSVFISRGRRNAFGLPVRPAVAPPPPLAEPDLSGDPLAQPEPQPVVPPRIQPKPVVRPDSPVVRLPPLLGDPVRDTATIRR